MSATLFNIFIDWVLHQTTENKPIGFRWTLLSKLEALDFADDLAMLSHTHNHVQEKTTLLNTFGRRVGLRISTKRLKLRPLM